jgi:hypothetical protein
VTPRNAEETRREAAIHEAAHAVIAWQHGLAVHEVTIQPEPGRAGMALHRNPWHDLEGSPADELHAAVLAAEVSYAGELAVQTYLDRLGCGNEEDISQIASSLQRVCGTREQLLLMARWVEQRVRDRLAETTTRHRIEAVAQALEGHGRLERKAFEALVTAATSCKGPSDKR